MPFRLEPEPYGVEEGGKAIGLLSRAREALVEHSPMVEQKLGGGAAHLMAETSQRIGQMLLLLRKMLALLEEGQRYHPPRVIPDPEMTDEEWSAVFANITAEHQWPLERYKAAMDDAHLYTECFYYVAFRARQALRKVSTLSSFEAVGVRDVRNHLIEHPDGKSSGVSTLSFAWGGPRGATVRAMRMDGENAFPDPGLFPNTVEFGRNLLSAILRSKDDLA